AIAPASICATSPSPLAVCARLSPNSGWRIPAGLCAERLCSCEGSRAFPTSRRYPTDLIWVRGVSSCLFCLQKTRKNGGRWISASSGQRASVLFGLLISAELSFCSSKFSRNVRMAEIIIDNLCHPHVSGGLMFVHLLYLFAFWRRNSRTVRS